MVDNTSDWLKGAISFMDGQGKRGCLHLADNAERTYFRQGLVDLTDSEYMNVNKESLNRMAAERLVASCRNELRGALLILLSNDALFLLSLAEEVERQHSGLLELAQLNLPDASTKETVIRVNTNRLNSSTYWASLDQSDAEDRRSVRLALAGEDSFPDSFKAVDAASKSRTGRPARRNVISLIVLTDAEDVQVFPIEELGSLKRTEVAESWLKMVTFEEDWAAKILDPRDATLLESEWVLRVCVIGNPFVRSILNVGEVLADEIHRSALERLLAQLKMYLGPGTHDVTRSGYSSDVGEIVSEWPGSDIDVQPFWSAGQSRSGLYEKGLRVVLPGYDSLFEGFLTYRPDYVVSAFRPCAISEAISDDEKAIRDAIKRAGHVFEFTAIANYSTNKVAEYLQEKLGNYVEVTQEQ
jgi:hypothetical protein